MRKLIKFLNYVMLLELSHQIDVMRETNVRMTFPDAGKYVTVRSRELIF